MIRECYGYSNSTHKRKCNIHIEIFLAMHCPKNLYSCPRSIHVTFSSYFTCSYSSGEMLKHFILTYSAKSIHPTDPPTQLIPFKIINL